jgi:hypothetical protein
MQFCLEVLNQEHFPSALGTGVNTEMGRGEFPYLADEETPDIVPRACVCIGTIAAI